MLRAFRSSGEKPNAFETPSQWPPRNVGACEGTTAAPPDATSPTRAEVDQIYGNLEAICELLQSQGTYCVLGKSIGALTELHPLDEGLPPGAIDFRGAQPRPDDHHPGDD
jgi:hypothetical protein